MNTYIESTKENLYETLSSLLKFRSVLDSSDSENHPYGAANTKALEYMLELGKEAGFEVKNMDNQVGYIQLGDQEDYVGVLCHLDVVPEGNDWTFEPFGGTIEETRIIGRGALDDKGPAAASFFALKAIKESGEKLDRSIRLIFGLNEETGSKCVKHYLTKEKPPVTGFTPDADFPVIYAEKGITTFNLKKTFAEAIDDGGIRVVSINGGTAVNMVPDYAEAFIEETMDITDMVTSFNKDFECNVTIDRSKELTRLSVKGVSAHASTPEAGTNAISLLMSCLDVLDLQIGDASSFVRAYVRRINMLTGGEGIGMGMEDDISGALTFNVGTVLMNEAGGSLSVNVRYPVTKSLEDVYNSAFKNIIELERFTYDVVSSVDPIVHDKDGELIKTLMDVYKIHTGDEKAQPICIGGGTYARSMPNIVAYGPLFPGAHDTMHQADEYIVKDDLVRMTKIYADAIYRLAK
ncbi:MULTISPECIES: dipeptidase PepV [unclassified Fusibacter]|uniref:dipeptidase PepV n=1 Tax=unclassified Fusibacter TaxID=2624464 RepID=UPI0013E8FA1A|nr:MULTISPECIES: dipeptidase PepV [unclassified Fusibacter]MCK8059816.1 dipeptidase PepV [Fusibacter sp. A2]NPE21617.1 dipeptidase PepV [Fusibacter sp. A1]